MFAAIFAIMWSLLCIVILHAWLANALTITANQRPLLIKAVYWDEKQTIGAFKWKDLAYWIYTPKQCQDMFDTVSFSKHFLYVAFFMDPLKLYPTPLVQRFKRYINTREGKMVNNGSFD